MGGHGVKWVAIGLFFGAALALGEAGLPVLTPLQLGLLGLATLRAGRMLAFDLIAAPLRAPFSKTVLDSYGATLTTAPAGRGWRRGLGELLTCPICAGTWSALGLLTLLRVLPGMGSVVLLVLACAGAAEIGHAVIEGVQWSGEWSRLNVGNAKRAGNAISALLEGVEQHNGNGRH